ncbi:hypothetical protein TNCV_3047301 [Trichonephila clavipes]|nr:hypothetical protein TNCV_3047301 [Trichonephila clavipes]
MPVVSAPCSCQPDCLVCGRGDVPPLDCAIHVLLESMVFQEHMLAFARSEPKDVSSDYVEQEASKGAFIQALWMPNPAYTVWHIRLGNDRVRKT